jgi:fucose 4-O-acetylase-like acetyltransferase
MSTFLSPGTLLQDNAEALGCPLTAIDEPKGARRHYLDWLRIWATFILIPYHTARIFDYVPWYIKNASYGAFYEAMNRFAEIWHMPLFFLISGAATRCFFDTGKGNSFLRERVKRLFVPFLFGVVVLVPPVTYIRFITLNPESGYNYLEYYPRFFNIVPKAIDGLAGTFTPLHLWFILFLFLFSLAAFPLLRYLATERGGQVLSKWAGVISRKATMILLVAGLPAVIRLIGLPYPDPLYFFLFFVLGFVLMSDSRFMEAISSHQKTALVLAVVTSSIVLFRRMREAAPDAFPVYQGLGIEAMGGMAAWFWMIAFLGYGRRYLNYSSALSEYLNKAAYPVYLTHMTFIVPLAFYATKWDMRIGLRYSFMNLITLAGTIAVYEVIIRRSRVTRFLFGLR